MPIFWFHVDTNKSPQAVIERIRPIVGKPPSWLESLKRAWGGGDPSAPPFSGSVYDSSFKIVRFISYRNSFLPVIRGSVAPANIGSRLWVIMYLDPVVALFMTFFFWAVLRAHEVHQGHSGFFSGRKGPFLIFGVALVAVGFFPEAWKAKRLISDALQNVGA
jgi:hypothetical protein